MHCPESVKIDLSFETITILLALVSELKYYRELKENGQVEV